MMYSAIPAPGMTVATVSSRQATDEAAERASLSETLKGGSVETGFWRVERPGDLQDFGLKVRA